MKRCIVCLMFCLAVVVGANADLSKDKQKALNKANYVAYQGQQQSWPTGDQAVPKTIETKHGVTIYRTLPGRAYEILGVIQVGPGGKVARLAAEAARAAGANAILVCPDDAFVKAGIAIEPHLAIQGDKARDISSLTGFLIRWKLMSTAPSPPASK
ncbi:MAG TPA: hypothetical protein VL486_16345 [Verrucomicrobiae bacterium]|nr:hypothetical protein [Verrucomicrobiae bacterium]